MTQQTSCTNYLSSLSISLLVLLLLGSFHPTASAQGINDIYAIAGEIRGQMAIVNAQAEATLCDCDDYDDVRDELEELCEKMDRFEQRLAEPIRSENQLRRLRKAAIRVDEQAEEVLEEIRDAIEDLRDDRSINRHRVNQFGYGYPRTQYYQLPPRFASANQFGFTTPGYGQIPTYGASYRSSGIQITLGGGRPRVQLVSTPVFASPYSRSDFRQAGLHGNSAANALCAEAERLQQLTCQLVRLLR